MKKQKQIKENKINQNKQSLKAQIKKVEINGLKHTFHNFQQAEINWKKHSTKQLKAFSRVERPENEYELTPNYEIENYLNRLGKIIKMLESLWDDDDNARRMIKQHAPILYIIIPLRDKRTAHRCIDAPYDEPKQQQEHNAGLDTVISMSTPFSTQNELIHAMKSDAASVINDALFTYPVAYPKKERDKKLGGLPAMPGIERITEDAVHLTLTLHNDHEKILIQIDALLSLI